MYNKVEICGLNTARIAVLSEDEKTAAEDACRMEHIISDKTFDRIKEHFEKYK